MSNPAYPDGCTNREIDQEVNPLMGDDINELNDQLKNVRKQMMEIENNSDGFNFSELVKLRKEEAEILERLEGLKNE